MTFRAAAILVALTGFIALSLELIWIRVYYFLSATRACAFAGLLSSYLLGLALGSLWSIRVQRKFENGTPAEQSRSVARLVLWANIAGFLVTPIVSWIAAVRIHLPEESHPWYWSYPLVGIAAAWMGTLLPLICHYAVPPDAKVGSRLSKLYLANIVGSGAGSLLTGFVLMEYIPLRWISYLMLVLSVLIYVVLCGRSRKALITGAVVLAAGAALTPPLYWRFWERMQHDYNWATEGDFTQIVESRSGVITIDHNNKIYGGGSYDGVVDTSPVRNTWLVRAYALSAMHPNPEEVLIIGLSGGAWAQITAANPYVKHITCVEINHSYKELVIPGHPAVASLLKNPKVEIVTDDGRRWLERNPGRKFDAILMNTTQHYREYASNLLCTEFQQLAKKHLKPGGVFQYNATGSLRAHRTALDNFESVNLLLNNIVTWNGPAVWDNARWKAVLENYRIDGQLVFDPAKEDDRLALERILLLSGSRDREPRELKKDPAFRIFEGGPDLEDYRMRSRAQLESACRARNADAITDDNLGHEYRWWQ